MKKIYTFFAVLMFLSFAGTAFAAAPVVTLQSATNITNNSATLSAVISSTSAVSNIFEYSTDPSFGSGVQTTFTSANSVNITGLSSGTTYYFRVSSSNSDGTTVAPTNGSGSSSYYSFKTLGYTTSYADTLGADSITTTSANLNGRVNTYGASGTYYFRYYAGSSCSSYLGNTSTQSLSSSSGMQYVSSVVTGLSAGQKYCSELVATISGTQYVGTKISFTTLNSNNNNNNNSCTIDSFYANPASISSGNTTTLYWTTTNCTNANLNNFGGSVAVNGSKVSGVLYNTAQYTLNASNSNNTDSETITVTVTNNNNNGYNNNPCNPTTACYWNGSSWVYYNNNNNNNNGYNNQPSCYYSGQCYWNGSSWVFYNNNNNQNNNGNTYSGTYPSCYYDASCYWTGSTWAYNNGGNVSGNYAPYVYNPHTPYTGGPNYVTKTISGGVNTVYVDQPITQYAPTNDIYYNNGYNVYGYDTSIMSRYSANYPYTATNNGYLLTGAAGSAGSITLIGLLIALIIIMIIVYVVRNNSKKELH